ncbi:hypothetical protein K402DRAFT_444683 [Aulographum hederae CBS 113979]|uniref:DUF676 domain-containing protein n=1 Tax=Aulographum hederae CBS 113979 TaxID=1176131 RepID=A0A6G1H984_9PEZI|nr:hypothetical protein K402DRAFT_444683 [Aulographum hederae CBS 113979]
MNAVRFLPSQIGGRQSIPIHYTGSPLMLLWEDLGLVYRHLFSVRGIIMPWNVFKQDPFDELFFSFRNIVALITHMVLMFLQSVFLLSVPFLLIFPTWSSLLYIAGFLILNAFICTVVLNRGTTKLDSDPDIPVDPRFHSEAWVYLNGVSIGRDWLQANVDRLSLTFGRRVIGVHNPTAGILFDLVQCLVQRNFQYATQDVRDAYNLMKDMLLDENNKKVVFILHSQGGIEGGLIVDWLLDEIPQDRMEQLEVYTFGNAANHFNNPYKSLGKLQSAESSRVIDKPGEPKDASTASSKKTKAIGYIEHYANQGDFVSQFGVINFAKFENRFMGRVFESPGSGHLLNQHYLHDMFPLNADRTRAMDESEFMDMEVHVEDTASGGARESMENSWAGAGGAGSGATSEYAIMRNLTAFTSATGEALPKRVMKVKDFSRLWQYRNGGSPKD